MDYELEARFIKEMSDSSSDDDHDSCWRCYETIDEDTAPQCKICDWIFCDKCALHAFGNEAPTPIPLGLEDWICPWCRFQMNRYRSIEQR
jgi:rubredoxin